MFHYNGSPAVPPSFQVQKPKEKSDVAAPIIQRPNGQPSVADALPGTSSIKLPKMEELDKLSMLLHCKRRDALQHCQQ